MKDNQLIQVLADNQVEPVLANRITTSLGQFLDQAQSLVQEAKQIIVTSENQADLMKLAREKRLELKDIRLNTESARKAMKEDIVRAGKAIDGAANIIKFLIVPEEERLEQQEKFAKIAQEKRLTALSDKRTAELEAYGIDCQFFNLKEMNEEAYQSLLSSSKTAFEAKKEAERKAEEERAAAEKARIEEEKRIHEENERLRKEKEEREKKEAAERKIRLAEEQKRQAELEKAKAAADKAQKALEEQKRAEEEARLAEEQKRKDEELARLKEEKAARLAPDKDKLIRFAATLDEIELPEVSNPEAQLLLQKVADYFANLKAKLIEEANQL